MDFKHFRYFVAVAEELHVGKAAQKLHIAQPALSQQIQQLESQLGVMLFNRENRRLTLSAAGSLFLAEARLVLYQADHAVRVVKQYDRGELGKVALGYIDSGMYSPVVRGILKGFKEFRPGVELLLHARNVMDQFSGLLEGGLDAGIVRGPLPILPEQLRCELVVQEQLAVCLPAGHRLASRLSIEARDLAEEMFITPIDPPGVGLAGQVSFIAQEAGFVPRVSQYAGQSTTMACLVASGFGIAILPSTLNQLHLDQVIYRPFANKVATNLYLVSRVEERNPAVLAFLDGCRAYFDGRGEG